MKIKEGYVYHIKEEYFKVVRDEKLMKITKVILHDQIIFV